MAFGVVVAVNVNVFLEPCFYGFVLWCHHLKPPSNHMTHTQHHVTVSTTLSFNS